MDSSIMPLEGEFALEEALEWEARIFHQKCAEAQREAVAHLEALDEALFAQRPVGWRVVGFRRRTVVTRFGEVCFRRRLYRDEQGKYRWLLDEFLRLPGHQAATPDMQRICSMMSGVMSYRKATEVLTRCLAGVLSASTCWRLLQRTGQAAAQSDAATVEAVFERGKPMAEAGKRTVKRLYMEADGVYVRLQRQAKTHLELRSAIAYEGWERLPTEREGYRLRGKRVYCHVGERLPFWEGAWLAWAQQWDLSRVREVIIGGDGAGWIRAGTTEFLGAIWQLDNFHLARACGRAYGAQVGQELYGALRAGKGAEAEKWLEQAPVREGKQAQRDSRWVRKVAQQGWGLDWRVRLGIDEEEGRGLGCMEGNEAHLLAERMKDKGRSWSPAGARHMAKVQELLTNDEIERWCYRPMPIGQESKRSQGRPTRRRTDPGQWLQASVPVLHGPAENAPWVEWLRQMIHPPHLPN
jgi:hypothetical protein